MDDLFSNGTAWSGSFYELNFRVGVNSVDRLTAVMAAVWSSPTIEGIYLDNRTPRSAQRRFKPDEIDCAAEEHRYGVATLPDGKQLPCATFAMCWEGKSNEVDFYFPTGGLSLAYPEVGCYPFDGAPASRAWREPLDAWLEELARTVYRVVKFDGALIGDECSGLEEAEIGDDVPQSRRFGILLPNSTGLAYYPTNDWPF